MQVYLWSNRAVRGTEVSLGGQGRATKEANLRCGVQCSQQRDTCRELLLSHWLHDFSHFVSLGLSILL